MPVSISGTNGVTFPDNSLQTAAASPFGLKNRIINGDMRIDQRNAGAATANTINGYTVDRWAVLQSITGKLIAQQNAGSVTPPAGFTNYLGVTSQSAYSVLASDIYRLVQQFEGLNVSDLGWGTANAATVTLSFWVRSSLTGTFGGAIGSITGATTYPFTYTISATNTWEKKSLTIPGPTSGTFATNNTSSIYLQFALGLGSSTSGGTANTWGTSAVGGPTGCVSVVGTNGATFYITGVQLEQNTSATPFERRLYNQELANCQRYYYKVKSSGDSFNQLCVGYIAASTQGYGIVSFPVELRTRPTALEQTGTASDYAYAHTNTATVCSSVPAYQAQTNSSQAIVLFTVASGLTAGQGGRGCSNNNNANAYLAWSSEL